MLFLDMALKALGSLYNVFSVMHFRTSCNSGAVASADRISSVSIALGGMWWVRWLTYPSAQLFRLGGCCRGVNIDSEFTRFREPGRYTRLKSYSCKRSCHLSMRAGGGLLALVERCTRGVCGRFLVQTFYHIDTYESVRIRILGRVLPFQCDHI